MDYLLMFLSFLAGIFINFMPGLLDQVGIHQAAYESGAELADAGQVVDQGHGLDPGR